MLLCFDDCECVCVPIDEINFCTCRKTTLKTNSRHNLCMHFKFGL